MDPNIEASQLGAEIAILLRRLLLFASSPAAWPWIFGTILGALGAAKAVLPCLWWHWTRRMAVLALCATLLARGGALLAVQAAEVQRKTASPTALGEWIAGLGR